MPLAGRLAMEATAGRAPERRGRAVNGGLESTSGDGGEGIPDQQKNQMDRDLALPCCEPRRKAAERTLNSYVGQRRHAECAGEQ